MGDKRSIIGIVVCFLALFIYLNFIYPWVFGRRQTPPAPAPPAPVAVPARPSEPGPVAGTTQAAGATSPAAVAAVKPEAQATEPGAAIKPAPGPPREPKEFEAETKLFKVVLTEQGAAIKSVTSKDFFLTAEGKMPLPLITDLEPAKPGRLLSLAVTEAGGAGDLGTRVWEYDAAAAALVPSGYSDVRQFKTVVPELELEITKTFLFRQPAIEAIHPPDGRDIEMRIVVRNLGSSAKSFRYRVRSAAGIVPEPELLVQRGFEQQGSKDIGAVVAAFPGGKAELKSFAPPKSASEPRSYGGTDAIYAGVRNRYFVAVLKPMTPTPEVTAVLIEKVSEHNVTSVLEMNTLDIPPGEKVERRFMFFVGPKMPEVLEHYREQHFDALMVYGWPAPVTRFLSWLLHVFRYVTPNYGWAIVLLTMVVRIVLHPLTLKSQKTTHKMQKIQPLMNAVKEKYKHDKKLQQQEVMKVMREHGANPMGGCLPMLLQMPIFIGLWRALYEEVGLRQAPFIFWINDLSKADNLFTFSTPLPLLGQSFNLLPILCAAGMLIQQMMSPKSADPQAQQQRKIMMIMPVVFTFMLYGMPSGLMVYFLCSSGFGLAEQHFIRRRLEAVAEAAAAEGKLAAPAEQKREERRKRRR